MQLSVDEIKKVASLHDVSIKVITRFTFPLFRHLFPWNLKQFFYNNNIPSVFPQSGDQGFEAVTLT